MVGYYKGLIENISKINMDETAKERLIEFYEERLKIEELKARVREKYDEATYNEKVKALFSECSLFEKLIIEILLDIRAGLEKKSIKDILGIKGGLLK